MIDVAEVIGLPRIEAEKLLMEKEVRYRIAKLDDEYMILTMDLRRNRLNLEICKGIVTDAKYY